MSLLWAGNPVSVYDAKGNAIFVSDVGDPITVYNSNGVAITIYDKDKKQIQAYYPYMLIKHDLDTAEGLINVYYTDDGSEPNTQVESELMPVVDGQRKIRLYNYTGQGAIAFKFRAKKEGYADSYIVTYTWS